MRMFLALVLLIAFAPLKSTAQEPHETSEPIWSCFGDCNNERDLAFELWMNGSMIHKTPFPVCPINDLSEEDPHHKILVFFFKGGYIFQGEYHTKPTQRIEGNIWQADTDAGDIPTRSVVFCARTAWSKFC